jgi:hypothetical protein
VFSFEDGANHIIVPCMFESQKAFLLYLDTIATFFGPPSPKCSTELFDLVHRKFDIQTFSFFFFFFNEVNVLNMKLLASLNALCQLIRSSAGGLCPYLHQACSTSGT